MIDKTQPYGIVSKLAMPFGCLYLNRDGSRWVTHDMRFVLVLPNGKRRIRLAVCWEELGNFATVVYKYKGKTFREFPKSHDWADYTLPLGGSFVLKTSPHVERLPHVFHRS